MILKGKVSSIEVAGIRVILVDKDNVVTPPLVKASHIGTLHPGDDVTVVLFNGSMSDGQIIAKL